MNTLKINGMSCQHCVTSVTEAIQNVGGVSQVSVDLDKGEAAWEGNVNLDEVKAAITKIGFEPV